MVIDNLCKNNWVKRTPNPSDRRSMIISLTDSGSAFIKDFFPKHLERIIKEFEILDPEELEQLGELAKKVGTQTK
jgi:MarR family 2-MHQ and catechol resistance regulon transcriptional repressor